jgi:hypothetical protein
MIAELKFANHFDELGGIVRGRERSWVKEHSSGVHPGSRRPRPLAVEESATFYRDVAPQGR